MSTSAGTRSHQVTPRDYTAPDTQTPRHLRHFLSLADFEPAAQRHLPRPLFGYVAGAAENNLSLRANLSAFETYGLNTKVLVDVSKRSQAITLFGKTYSSPFGIAPMGLSALCAYRGDLVLARAAQCAGIPMVLSGSSLIRMEDVIQQAPDAWFQAYVPGDFNKIDALLDRVNQAGFQTLVVTVDLPVAGNRENNIRAGFSTPLRPSLRLAWDGLTRPRWLLGTFARTLWKHGMPHFENSFAQRGAPVVSPHVLRDFSARDHLNWDHLDHIRRLWQGNLVIKGVLTADDALRSRDHGADGIIVSNHGGRQLDGARPPLFALPSIVRALDESCPVMMDGGIRRGTDVLKALALGAKLVFIGRPFNYAAAVANQAGVEHAITLLRDEIHRDMAMMGINHCTELNLTSLYRLCP